jgi:hypothetical protein
MAIFNSYVKLPEGKWDKIYWLCLNLQKWDRLISTWGMPGCAWRQLDMSTPMRFHLSRCDTEMTEHWLLCFFFNIIASYLNILFSLRKLLVSYRSITRKTKPLCRESCPQRAFLGDVSATDKKWEEAQPLPRLQASLESRCASRPPKSLRSHQKADGQEAQWIQWDWGSNRCYSWHSWELHWNILESILKFGWHAITKVLFRFLLFSKLIV